MWDWPLWANNVIAIVLAVVPEVVTSSKGSIHSSDNRLLFIELLQCRNFREGRLPIASVTVMLPRQGQRDAWKVNTHESLRYYHRQYII